MSFTSDMDRICECWYNYDKTESDKHEASLQKAIDKTLELLHEHLVEQAKIEASKGKMDVRLFFDYTNGYYSEKHYEDLLIHNYVKKEDDPRISEAIYTEFQAKWNKSTSFDTDGLSICSIIPKKGLYVDLRWPQSALRYKKRKLNTSSTQPSADCKPKKVVKKDSSA